ncbi:integrase/recombinase XerD [Shimia isoporae]|uniref:Integrase/recombinase XerD n=1 Tax=Shimia isoporae TaxID=647720 RepID=A0A4R1N3K7_9RHOB|nr:site-specific integrase [Shimia isoporae]TCL01196.1 integrase/recombinase XerD [Shimia isoporae]
MAQGKQAKILTNAQIQAVLRHLEAGRNADRNKVTFLLTVKAGLRAKEVAGLHWSSVLNSEGEIGDHIELTDQTSKGRSGRIIPMNRDLRKALVAWQSVCVPKRLRRDAPSFPERAIICTERSDSSPAQVIVNMFHRWYRDLGFVGASSHSGRRTFISNAAKKVVQAGGSLRDVQELAGHSSLSMTQRYIEGDTDAKRRLVQMI